MLSPSVPLKQFMNQGILDRRAAIQPTIDRQFKFQRKEKSA